MSDVKLERAEGIADKIAEVCDWAKYSRYWYLVRDTVAEAYAAPQTPAAPAEEE